MTLDITTIDYIRLDAQDMCDRYGAYPRTVERLSAAWSLPEEKIREVLTGDTGGFTTNQFSRFVNRE